LGLLGFAATTFILSMYNVGARGIGEPNVVLGMALGYGGLVQLIAGVEEWACGNVSHLLLPDSCQKLTSPQTFGATAFSSYGGFWFSFGAIYIPFFQIPREQLITFS
jgi:succinate-acetate transporter protein